MVSAEVDSGAGRFRRWERRRDPEHPRNLKRIRERDDHRQAHRFHLEFPRNKKRMRVAGCSHRKWAYSPCDLSSYNDRFIIVSYNILGDENVSKHSDLYSNVPPEHLCWEKRKNRMCKELRSCNPSILCFQEVDHYDELADLLHKDGYTGVYKGRTGCTRDGCAIFWKEESGFSPDIPSLVKTCTQLDSRKHLLVTPNAVLSEVHQSQKSGVHGNGKIVFNDQESEVREGYGPWMIAQPRRRRNMGNSWRFEAPIPNGLINNSFSRRNHSSDRRGRALERRRSHSVRRGREPMRRMWAQKNSTEGQHDNRSSRAAMQHFTKADDADAREYHSDGPTTLH